MRLPFLSSVAGCRWFCTLFLVASLGPAWAQPAPTQAPGGALAEAQQLYEQSAKLWEAGKYAEAQLLAERTLAIREKALGPEHPEVAQSCHNLARLYWSRGDYAGAEPLYKRAIAIREKALGPDHRDLAKSLNNLAILYMERGDYAEAEPLYKRALAIHEALEPEHPNVAGTLNNLAILYVERGDYAGAEPLYKRALAIHEALGPDRPDVAKALNNLGVLYMERGDYAEAELLYKRALVIYETLGPEHPDVGGGLHNLAILYVKRGDYAGAEPLYKRALAIREKALGPDHPGVAKTLHSLAILYMALGEFDQAEPLLGRALAIRERALGPTHPDVAEALYDLAALQLARGRADGARQSLRRALDVQEQNLSLNLAAGSEARNRAYLGSLKDTADLAVWMHLQRAPADPKAARLALAAVLGRKGRVLEEAALALARLRRRLPAEGRQPLQQLADARARLASLVFQNSGSLPSGQYQARVGELRAQVRQLEEGLTDAGSPLRTITRPLALKAIQQALPKDGALVEFVLYRPFNPKASAPVQRFGAPRYAAYWLRPTGTPLGVDLGEAKQIDELAAAWRSWLLDPASPADGPVRKLGRLLHQRLFAPLGDHPQVKHLLIAPDGQLNTLPFAALVQEDGRALLQDHTLTYLVSGRELPRLAGAAAVPRSAPLVLGGPDFGYAVDPSPVAQLSSRLGSWATGTEARFGENLRSPALTGFTVRPLPGAKAEAAAIARLLGVPFTELLTGERATENALKAARAPALLHLATHGFFLEDQGTREKGNGFQEPLLRSGVALAGFNARSSGAEDGVLTALEAQGLDLEGTELAVISACQSGAGAIVGGEGVQGLRRALALAGTRSQVLALWPVGDRTTAELMGQFYRGLAGRVGRSEALRRAQLTILARPGRSHPFWWASFAASGDWRPVQLPRRQNLPAAVRRCTPASPGSRPHRRRR